MVAILAILIGEVAGLVIGLLVVRYLMRREYGADLMRQVGW